MQNLNVNTLISLNRSATTKVNIAVTGLYGNTTLNEENLVVGSFKLQRSSAAGSVIEIGSSETSQIEFEIDNDSGAFDSFIFEGANLDISIQIPIDGSTSYEILVIGKFIVDNQPKKETIIKIIALDYMAKFNKDYSLSTLSYPASLIDIINDACTICGVTLVTSDFINKLYEVPVRPESEDLTFHQVISWVAELAGCIAWIDHLGQLNLTWYGENQGINEINIDKTIRWSYEAEESNITITGISAKVEDTEYLAGTDDYALMIVDNGLLQDDVQAIINNINTKINGFTYRPLRMKIVGYPHLWAGDLLNEVTAPNLETFQSCVIKYTYVLNGDTTIEAVGESQQMYGYASASPFTSRQKSILKKLAEIEASRQVSSLEQETLNLNSIISNSVGFFQTIVEDELTGAKIAYIHDSSTLEGSDTIYTMTESGFAWTNDGWNGGNPVWQYGYTQEGNAILNILSVTGLNAEWINTGKIKAEFIDISISGENIVKNSLFFPNGSSSEDEVFIHPNFFEFGLLIASTTKIYGWEYGGYNADGESTFLLENGWLWSSIQAQQFSYGPKALISSAINVSAGNVYTLSYYGWDIQSALSGIRILISNPALPDAYFEYDIFDEPIIENDSAYNVRSEVGARVPDFEVPVRVGEEPPYTSGTMEFTNFRPTRYIVTFTLPEVIDENRIFLYIRDERISNSSYTLMSKLQLEIGNKATAWKPFYSELTGKGVNLTYDGLEVFGANDANIKLNSTDGLAFYKGAIKQGDLSLVDDHVAFSTYGFDNANNVNRRINFYNYGIGWQESTIADPTTWVDSGHIRYGNLFFMSTAPGYEVLFSDSRPIEINSRGHDTSDEGNIVLMRGGRPTYRTARWETTGYANEMYGGLNIYSGKLRIADGNLDIVDGNLHIVDGTFRIANHVQYPKKTYSFSAAIGWRRLAYNSSSSGRGSAKIYLWTTGGGDTPRHIEINAFHDWGNAGFFPMVSNASFNISQIRFTESGGTRYIEAYFASSIEDGKIALVDYGYNGYTMYTGTLPAGGGTVETSIPIVSGLCSTGNIRADGSLFSAGNLSVSGTSVFGDTGEFSGALTLNNSTYNNHLILERSGFTTWRLCPSADNSSHSTADALRFLYGSSSVAMSLTVNHDLTGLRDIVVSRNVIAGSIATGTNTTHSSANTNKTISFGKTFSSAPQVVTTTSDSIFAGVCVTAVTTTGFTTRCSVGSKPFRWIAIL